MIVDTSVLPTDALTYTDEQFFHLVRNLCGNSSVNLLEILCIRSVQSFLLTDTKDIFSVINFDCDQLEDIKREICFQLQDKSYIIKPGVESSIKYLKELLLTKNNEHITRLKKKVTPPPPPPTRTTSSSST
ncbi:unnamed protein product, partial [Rotaria sordida]